MQKKMTHLRSGIVSIVLIAVFSVSINSCCPDQKTIEKLTVAGGDTVVYVSDSGDRILARYFTLSDSTLDFVRITLPQNKVFTLPRVMSASGVRYSNDADLVWWSKGNSAFAQVRDTAGQWVVKYNCKEAGKNN
jgi:membrane-bound inhibitor of C-type lysozyme